VVGFRCAETAPGKRSGGAAAPTSKGEERRRWQPEECRRGEVVAPWHARGGRELAGESSGAIRPAVQQRSRRSNGSKARRQWRRKSGTSSGKVGRRGPMNDDEVVRARRDDRPAKQRGGGGRDRIDRDQERGGHAARGSQRGV
jgi:hypothetical protein